MNSQFLVMNKEVEPPGCMTADANYDIPFVVDKVFESYYGRIVSVR
jgi:hypothetical protein